MAKAQRDRSPSPIEELTFEESMARLEEIVAELQRQDIPLEKAFDLWEEGRKLHAHCTAILDRLKKRLEESTVPKEEEDGDTSEEDWDGSEEDWEESDEDADEA